MGNSYKNRREQHNLLKIFRLECPPRIDIAISIDYSKSDEVKKNIS